MAFKSEAQRRKFQELLKQGKISKSIVDAFEAETSGKLPERVKGKAKDKKPPKNKAWLAKVIK